MNKFKDWFTKDGISLSDAIKRQEEYENSFSGLWHFCKTIDGDIGIIFPNDAIDVPFEVIK